MLDVWAEDAQSEIDRLRVEMEALRADAERYQYLRDQCRNTDPNRMYFGVSRNVGHDWECVINLDSAVDVARKDEGAEGA